MNNCIKSLIAAGFLLFVLLVQHLQAQDTQNHHHDGLEKITDKIILKQLLNEKGISNRQVQLEVVNFPPGSSSPAHRHPCPTFGYVLEGEIESVFEGQHHLYRKGDAFYEKTNGLHAVTRNNDHSKAAKLLVFFVAENNKPTTISLKK